MRATDQGGGSGGCTEGQQAVRKGVWKEQREGRGAGGPRQQSHIKSSGTQARLYPARLSRSLWTSQETPNSPGPHTLAHNHLPRSLTLTRSSTGLLSLTREDGGALVENEWGLEKDGWSPGALRSVAQQ